MHGFFVAQVLLYAAELVVALEHVHAHQIIFRDLKPENVMVSEIFSHAMHSIGCIIRCQGLLTEAVKGLEV